MKPDNIILEGVTGSTAYGLATENSDIDIKGIYQLPTEKVLSMGFTNEHNTVDHTNPDWVYHELGKFMSLVMKGNPTITELLFLDEYTIMTPIGQLLVDNRAAFLSTKAISKSYRGYALGQAQDLAKRFAEGKQGYDSSLKNRYAKHTRHCFRLLLQARQFLETGTLNVRVSQEEREYLFKMGEQPVDFVVDEFMRQDRLLDDVVSVLPDKPNKELLNDLLVKIRTEDLL